MSKYRVGFFFSLNNLSRRVCLSSGILNVLSQISSRDIQYHAIVQDNRIGNIALERESVGDWLYFSWLVCNIFYYY